MSAVAIDVADVPERLPRAAAGPASKRVVVGYGFATLGLHRLEATVTPGNAASVALLERNGFRREGLLRGHGYWKGAFQDVELFARLSSD